MNSIFTVILFIVELHIFLTTLLPTSVIQRRYVAQSDFVIVYIMYVTIHGLISFRVRPMICFLHAFQQSFQKQYTCYITTMISITLEFYPNH